jgi:hypothetical protein
MSSDDGPQYYPSMGEAAGNMAKMVFLVDLGNYKASMRMDMAVAPNTVEKIIC